MTMHLHLRSPRSTRRTRERSPHRSRHPLRPWRTDRPFPPPPRPALSLLEALADSLAEEGITIRGAFARGAAPGTPPPPLTPPSATASEVFAARFELPTTGKDGAPFVPAVILGLLRDLHERMGGATFIEAVGVWRDRQGVWCFDLVLAVEVWTHDRAGLVDYVRRARRELDQEAMAIRITRPEFVWVDRAEVAP